MVPKKFLLSLNINGDGRRVAKDQYFLQFLLALDWFIKMAKNEFCKVKGIFSD